MGYRETLSYMLTNMQHSRDMLGEDPHFREQMDAIQKALEETKPKAPPDNVQGAFLSYPVRNLDKAEKGYYPHDYIPFRWMDEWTALSNAEGWGLLHYKGVIVLKSINGQRDDVSMKYVIDQARLGSLRHILALYLHGTKYTP